MPTKWLKKIWDPKFHPLRPAGAVLEWMAKKADAMAVRMGNLEDAASIYGLGLEAGGRIYKKIKEEEEDRIRSQL